MDSEEIKHNEQQASWHACLSLREVANSQIGSSGSGLNWIAFGNAMFNAGQAMAYFKARDHVETLEAKVRDAKATRGTKVQAQSE